ncbi:hypothetical protein ABIC03_007979 [Bradyrhizobium sp. RT6a]
MACKYAAQPAHLAKLRAELPARIAASPAGNVEIYTREVEAAYRRFWRDYCAAAAEGSDVGDPQRRAAEPREIPGCRRAS